MKRLENSIRFYEPDDCHSDLSLQAIIFFYLTQRLSMKNVPGSSYKLVYSLRAGQEGTETKLKTVLMAVKNIILLNKGIPEKTMRKRHSFMLMKTLPYSDPFRIMG